MPINHRSYRNLWMLALSIVGQGSPIGLASPARAASPPGWVCGVDSGGSRLLSLSSSDLEAAFVDRNSVDLTCRLPADLTASGQLSLCVSTPGASHSILRRLKRDAGPEEINYRLTASAASGGTGIGQGVIEPGPVPQPVSALSLTGAPAEDAVVRLSMSVAVETGMLRGRFLPEGRYHDPDTVLALSVHEGPGCGPVLWEARLDSDSSPLPAFQIPASCEIETLAPVQFGTLADMEVETRRSGALGVRCSPGSAYSIELGPGNQPRSGSRFMVLESAASSDANTLPYVLLAPDGREWSGPTSPVTGGAFSGVGTGVTTTIPVTGVIRAGAPRPVPGVYRDQVIATLVY